MSGILILPALLSVLNVVDSIASEKWCLISEVEVTELLLNKFIECLQGHKSFGVENK